jgi:hypothetical protein
LVRLIQPNKQDKPSKRNDQELGAQGTGSAVFSGACPAASSSESRISRSSRSPRGGVRQLFTDNRISTGMAAAHLLLVDLVSLVYLVCLVDLVYLVFLVHLVDLVCFVA